MSNGVRSLAITGCLLVSLVNRGMGQPNVIGKWAPTPAAATWPLQTHHAILLKNGKVICLNLGGWPWCLFRVPWANEA